MVMSVPSKQKSEFYQWYPSQTQLAGRCIIGPSLTAPWLQGSALSNEDLSFETALLLDASGPSL